MQLHTSMLAILAPLATMTSAVTTPVQDDGTISPMSHTTRTPCSPASDRAASAGYRRCIAFAENIQGDDGAGAVLAIDF
ncbi:hypothetical protein F4804DRAFT_329334 [Jackrogersella minutella]|nr:hypothetical protein F4804DRAFT_329334 [Jackrogersella minutella]